MSKVAGHGPNGEGTARFGPPTDLLEAQSRSSSDYITNYRQEQSPGKRREGTRSPGHFLKGQNSSPLNLLNKRKEQTDIDVLGPGFLDEYYNHRPLSMRGTRYSPFPRPNKPPTRDSSRRPTTTTATTLTNDLKNITSLSLLTEDLPALTSFYTEILGATLLTPTGSSDARHTAHLAFHPRLTVTLRTSASARAGRLFGDEVTVGRTASMPKRAMMGVEVRDVGAVWARLRDLGVGQAADDEAEMLGEVRVDARGGRRSVCFVDLAGHCWEAWQELL
ncbi:unnamed protein product [Discula destructiva]